MLLPLPSAKQAGQGRGTPFAPCMHAPVCWARCQPAAAVWELATARPLICSHCSPSPPPPCPLFQALQAPCPNCGTEAVTYFGDILTVPGAWRASKEWAASLLWLACKRRAGRAHPAPATPGRPQLLPAVPLVPTLTATPAVLRCPAALCVACRQPREQHNHLLQLQEPADIRLREAHGDGGGARGAPRSAPRAESAESCESGMKQLASAAAAIRQNAVTAAAAAAPKKSRHLKHGETCGWPTRGAAKGDRYCNALYT